MHPVFAPGVKGGGRRLQGLLVSQDLKKQTHQEVVVAVVVVGMVA